jgi:hypothetical protein
MLRRIHLPLPNRRRRRVVLASVIIGSLLSCRESNTAGQYQLVDEDTTDRREVRATLDSYYDAFSERDWPRFESHFWEGATMTTIWVPEGESVERVVTTSIPDFVAQAPSGPGSREIFEERLVSARIVVEGDLAQVRVTYHARFGDPGDVMKWEGLDAFTLLRFGGEWRISSLAFLANSD